MPDTSSDPPHSNSTRTLLRDAAEGDQAALAVLFERNRALLYALVHSRMPGRFRSRLDTDDVVQSALLAAFRELPAFQYTGEHSFQRWLAAILVNKIHDKIKHHSRQRRSVDAELNGTSGRAMIERLTREEDTPSVVMAAAESQALMLQAIGRLPADQQDLICLRFFDRLSWKEIAERLDISETNARRRGLECIERLVSSLV